MEEIPLEQLALGIADKLGFGLRARDVVLDLAKIRYLDWMQLLLPGWNRPVEYLKNVPWILSTKEDPTLLAITSASL